MSEDGAHESARPPGKVLLGFDPVASPDDVLNFGPPFAAALGAEPEALSVLGWPPAFLSRYPQLREQLDREIHDRFEETRERQGVGGLELRVVPGPSVSRTLHDLAEEEAAKAIVVGSAHTGVVQRTLAGSVGGSLMHGAPCPVAIVPRGYADKADPGLGNIAVAFDGSEESSAALALGIELVQRLGGRLTVLCAADPARYSYGAGWPAGLIDELERAEQEHAEKELERAQARIPSTIAAEGRILTGHAPRVLSDVSGDFDLMLSGSRGHGPLRRTVLGSTTRSLIRTAACPVLVLPRGG